MARYKQINVDLDTFNEIAKMADDDNRTMGGQVKHMLKMVKQNYRILSISELPHPEDAEPVPVVTVTK